MPETVLHELRFPALPGPVSLDQITDADREALQSLAGTAKSVIEIGTFLGGSAEAMLGAMPEDGQLVTIDTFNGTIGANTALIPSDTVRRYVLGRLARFKDRVTIIQGNSTEIVRHFSNASADLVFIDAAHDYENVKADIRAWLSVVKPDGIMAGHDYDKCSAFKLTEEDIVERSHLDWDQESGAHCGVIRAVRESFRQIMQTDDLTSSVWWAKPEWAR